MRLIALSLTLLANWTLLFAQPTGIRFEIQPSAIWVGDSASLEWSVPGAGEIYISSLGIVPAAGKMIVHPVSSKTFTLMAELNGKIVSKTAHLQLQGSKGAEECPESDAFERPFSHQLREPSLNKLLDRIRRVLQDNLAFIVGEFRDEQNRRYVFRTCKSSKRYLVGADETRISARRIAYLVEVDVAGVASSPWNYRIKTFIEYKRRIEREWRREENEELYRRETLRLKETIARISQ